MELSFAARAKAELCRVKTTKKCCAAAECYGALLYCNSFTSREIRVITGSAEFAERLPRLFRRAFGFGFDVLPAPDTRPGARRTLLIEDRDKLAGVFRAFGMEPDDTLTLHINLGVLEKRLLQGELRARGLSRGREHDRPGQALPPRVRHNARRPSAGR